jgi:DNA-binding NarL/FixJ family response regulator
MSGAAVRVLVADDSVAFREAASDVVAATPGFELVGATGSGDRAVAIVEAAQPDLVLLDLRMPGVDGLEAARRIQEAAARTMVVLISADGDALARGRQGLPTIDKRSLSPMTLLEVWRERRPA